MVELASDPMGDEKNRRVIATWMLEQAYGRVPQSMEITESDGLSPNMMSSDQLRMYASGKVRELILNLHQTGKLDEYLKSTQLSLEGPKPE